MLRHILILRLKPHAEGADRATNLRRARDLVMGLQGRIPGLRRIEVGFNVVASERNGDLCLLMDFDDVAALEAYRVHPEHVAIGPFMIAIRESTLSIDYEVDAR